jgi:hypothetical protein
VSGTITAGPVTATYPTSISFANSVVYTYPGKVTNLSMGFSPSNVVFANSIFKFISSHQNVTTRGTLSSSTGSEVIQITGSNPGNTASSGHSVTLTAPSNTGGATVTIKTKFQMMISDKSVFYDRSDRDWFNTGSTISWNINGYGTTTHLKYVRAYYGANETEWNRASTYDAEDYLTRISTSEYTITSSSADITVSKADSEGIAYKLERSPVWGVRDVTLTITVGGGSTAQTFFQTVTLEK